MGQGRLKPVTISNLKSRSRSYENEVWEGWNFGFDFREAGKAGKRSPISVKIVQKGWKMITNFTSFGWNFVLTAVATLRCSTLITCMLNVH